MPVSFVRLAVLATATLLPVFTHAGVTSDIPSCYAANKLTISAPMTDMELFVVVDQTTPLDEKLKNSVLENVGRLVKPGNAFVVASFSSFGQGRYLEVLSAGALEGPVADKVRDDISVTLLRNFDACMNGQLAFGRKTAAAALNKALNDSSSDLAKSDIMGSLRELSVRVKQSKARTKVVFLVSDMLENSGITSFYASRNVRLIDPTTEMKKAVMAKQTGDFEGARVFVLGAGLVQDSSGGKSRNSDVYRDPKAMSALKQFWNLYFTGSNASLAAFGAPALIVPVE